MNRKLSRRFFNIGLALAVILIFVWAFLQKDWIGWCGVGVFAVLSSTNIVLKVGKWLF